MTDLFKDILPSILQTKVPIEDIKAYNAFMVNRALSYHPDCIFHANQMNMLAGLEKDLQNRYFLNSLRSFKRPYTKWAKPIENSDLQAVKMYYGYSDRQAAEALKVLTDEQIAYIKEKTKSE